MTDTFHHADPTPAEAAWFGGPLSRTPSLDAPQHGARLLVVAAHPDDETLGAGGLIAAAHARGAAVTVVIASDGEASHPHATTHTAEDLALRRRSEVLDAIGRLAPDASVHFLGIPDGDLTAFIDTLTAHVTGFAGSATHVVGPWEGDRHPDHAACAQATAAAARRFQLPRWSYPIWAWHWADPGGDDLPWEHMARLPLAPDDVSAKARAIRSHVSQHAALSDQPGDEPVLTAEMLAHFERPFEAFVVDDEPASTAGWFDALYEQTDDPWQLEHRFYERRKRELLLATLPRARFRSAFEPGCATGLLTERLAQRCDRVLAWDVAERAVAQTAARVAPHGNVTVERSAVPTSWPSGSFDLIVLSEVGYYCPDLDALAQAVRGALTDDGVLIACHWRHTARQHPHTGDEVHRALAVCGTEIVAHAEADFLLGVWTRSGQSVAVETGVLS